MLDKQQLGDYALQYFTFDKPVPYKLKDGNTIQIHPVHLQNAPYFLTSYYILSINKNEMPSVEIIQMSYLEFLYKVAFQKEESIQAFINICILCLGIKSPRASIDSNGKSILIDGESKIAITAKEFDDIRRIILYQNIFDYDDSYINPDIKKAMDEYDRVKGKNVEAPSIERRIGIISAHTGITKEQQMSMTYRAHTILFNEVCGEVEFSTTRAVALIGGAKDFDHWIYKKRKDKFSQYVTNVDTYANSMGAKSGAIKTTTGNTSEYLINLANSFTSNK